VKEGADSDDENRNSKKEKTKSVLYQMEVTLEDIYRGTRKQLEINRFRLCESCHGKGTNKKGINPKCSVCNGKGARTVVRQIAFGLMQQTVNCDECGGYFKFNSGEGIKIKETDKCNQCSGKRIIKKEKILEVDIEKGAPDKKRYLFQGESDEYPGAIPGDVLVEILIKKHDKLNRIGADLAFEINITLYEALSGFSFIFNHLDGRKVLIKSKEGEIMSHGFLKTVKELGMPFYEQPHKFGNLYLKISVIFPEQLGPSEKEIIHSILSAQNIQEIIPNIEEKYYLSDFVKSDENTHHSGGRIEDRRHGEY
jgi:DnaJ family protein A protein 2